MKPGVYTIPEPEYHADPAPEPSLSSSIAKLLVERSPRHAWAEHPRLNPAHVETNRKDFDLGHAAHALLLEGRRNIAVVDADSFRTKEARAARDAAYEAGKTPLLTSQLEDVEVMVKVAEQQIKGHAEASVIFRAGAPEQTLIWRERDIWLRCRIDWWNPDDGYPADYKSTTDAHPDAWQRRLFDLGYDMQAAFYMRGIRALGLHETPKFRFVVQETSPPYALSVVALTPAALALGEARVERAIEVWRWCITRDHWPGYPAQTCWVDAPAWKEMQWEADKMRREQAQEEGRDFTEALLHWQAPVEKGAAQ